jgi:hypothetical protein
VKLLDISENPSGIIISHRSLPAVFMALFMTAFIGFGAY